ncbi:hypothetical protein RE474_09590 [Methanolobus sediminis]|uniref:Uncharacterized protein n=1 Tax=Methanolobus sediminis TaxID=3072978 RepID=A0AA51YIB4_9EURY|nr:hypothetical protein [Methanolobus sediminis]WMW24341.1 hypothetical protein RE474_09590 [Methanolobus sediminis]
MNNSSLIFTGIPDVSAITYIDILDNLGADVVRIFALCGVCVLLYALINIFVDRDKVLFSKGPITLKIEDFDYFMLMMGLYFSIIGMIFYFKIPIS